MGVASAGHDESRDAAAFANDEPAVGDAYLQGRMVESAPRAMFEEGCDRLVDLPIQSDNVTARTQRDP